MSEVSPAGMKVCWRRRRGSSPAARRGARQRAGLTPASASNTLSCQRETLHSQQLKSIKKSIDSDHGIYRDLRNVGANYPFERSHRFAGIQANSGDAERSRLSCEVGDTQLGPNARISAECVARGAWSSRRIPETAGIDAILGRSRDDPAASTALTA